MFDYDMAIAGNFAPPTDQPATAIWPLYETLAGFPLLILRGELSDLLDAKVARQMAATLPDAELVTVPGVGHPPALDEPEAIAAIERLLARVSSACLPTGP